MEQSRSALRTPDLVDPGVLGRKAFPEIAILRLLTLIHLSFRHLWTAVAGVEDETRTVRFALSGMDAQRPQSDYFEVCDAFAAVSKLAYTMILASWGPVRPPVGPVQNAA